MNKETSHITRDSNIELLRIIAMFFILCHHFLCNSLHGYLVGAQDALTPGYATYSFMEGFFYVGVNCFLLISGYYGIKLRARKIWSFYLQLAFYGGVCYLLEALYFHQPITHTLLTKTLLIFSHPCWWFVAYFLLLMFLSPWINYGIKLMTKKQYQFALIGMTFVQIYLGWLWQKTCYDPNGYSMLNFIYIYLIGGYIGRFSDATKTHVSWKALAVYVICALVWGGGNILRLWIDLPVGNHFGYNNPIVIIGAVALFLFMLSWQFQNSYVNWLAGGAFAVYLITDTPYVGYHMYDAYGRYITAVGLPLWAVIAITLLVAVVVLLLCCSIDKLRAWMMKPVLPAFDWVDRKFELVKK